MKGKVAQASDVEKYLGPGLKERERRKIMRQVEKGELMVRETADGKIELFEKESEEDEEDEECLQDTNDHENQALGMEIEG